MLMIVLKVARIKGRSFGYNVMCSGADRDVQTSEPSGCRAPCHNINTLANTDVIKYSILCICWDYWLLND